MPLATNTISESEKVVRESKQRPAGRQTVTGKNGEDMQRRRGNIKRLTSTGLPNEYPTLLEDIKARIRSAQIRAALSVNRELIHLYWDIGRAIVLRQQTEGWGAKVIDRLADDLQREFTSIAGFSRANIYRMRAFFLAHREDRSVVSQPARRSGPAVVSQPARQSTSLGPPEPMASLPWFHNVVLVEQVSDPAVRRWYAEQAVANGWSRSMLEHWIESDLHSRQGRAVTNFKTVLPPPQSDLAEQVIKDPYHFGFLTLDARACERQLEEGLTGQITRFLLELGAGFAFVGRQMHFEIDGEDFYVDLLFYHLQLRCFVVVDLKTRRFEPEFAGKMNFYLSAVDDRMRKPGDAPSIGLILCKTRSRIIAEYALRHLQRPVGVARYVIRLTEKLPRKLADKLPTVGQIEAELSSAKPARRPRPRRRGGRGKRT